MIDPISLFVGAVVFGGGMLAGRVTRRKPTAAPAADVPSCPCGHSIALHDADNKVCHAEVERKRYYKNGDLGGRKWVPCACRRYLGPELPSEIYARYVGEVQP